jgi:hypothetical protein
MPGFPDPYITLGFFLLPLDAANVAFATGSLPLFDRDADE